MNKILLVYEDYADLMSVEATLKKVGFDVIGLSSEYSIAEQILSFNPDVVIGAGRGGKVSSLGVGKRLKEMVRWQGKSLLIFPANFKPTPQELIKIRVDMILESPVPPLRILQVLAKLLGHDEAQLLERLNKAMHAESSQKPGGSSLGGRFTSEEEAILVRGSTEGGESGSGTELPSTSGLEKGSQDISTSDEDKRETPGFRFGSRMQAADLEPHSAEDTGEQAFPDVDLKSLERELLGGGAPEVERVDVSPELSGEVTNPEQEVARAELKKADEQLAEKMKKYAAMVRDVKVSPKSTVTRVEARRRQLSLVETWDQKNINELDRLRREFTKALFKK